MIDVHVHEVGTRDGLQSVPFFVPTETKKRWCSAEARAGVGEIEVCSFVPVRLLPQFADAAEVVAHALTLEGLTVAALAPNLKGAQRAIELGVHKINYVLSVSESHNRANVRRSTEESVNDFARVVELARSVPEGRRPKIVAGLATALGCTIEGKVPEARVREIAAQVVAAGADELIVADTVGYADPASVRRLFKALRSDVGAMSIKAHFHDTRGLGLANVLAALDADVRAFDASLGGLGGCPYAPGASGNICTEDLVFMLEAMGLKTGVDLEQLIALRGEIQEALKDQPFHGTIAKAGLPKGFEKAA
ncbi:MAG: yngG 3 [Betaproteobacteria bacterium]|nr:yngG 3 [Betaproteobacteria bacterium]